LGVTKATLGKLVFWVGWATGWHAVAIYGAGYLGSEHAVTYTVATTLFLLVLAGALVRCSCVLFFARNGCVRLRQRLDSTPAVER
jgi:hypothetical protein